MRKTIEEMIAAQKQSMRESATKERKELRLLERLAKAFPGLKPDSIHPTTLCGAVAKITFGDKFTHYGQEDTRLTMQDVALLLDTLPPVKVWKVKDGCLAMRPDWDISDAEFELKNTQGSISDHWGVMLDVEPGINSGGASQSVEWFTEKNGLRLRIECILKPDEYPATVDIRAKRQFGRGAILRVEDTLIQPRGSFWLDQRVKWSQGGNQYAHKFTCYWLCVDDSQGAGKAWLEQVCGENFPPKPGHFQS